MNPIIERLLRDERIERVRAGPEEVEKRLIQAETHLKSAELTAEIDPAGAYSLLYDAVRKAVDAHMLSCGYRTRAIIGAHAASVEYSRSIFSANHAPLANHFNRMRRMRNKTEYDLGIVTPSMVTADLKNAITIVAVIRGLI